MKNTNLLRSMNIVVREIVGGSTIDGYLLDGGVMLLKCSELWHR